jgi:peptidyl-tRNA hydrolase
MIQYMEMKDESRDLIKQMSSAVDNRDLLDLLKAEYSMMGRKISIMGEWLKAGVRKVVLKADAKEWRKIKDAYPECALVVDAGLTEIPSGSETVIGLWPMRKSQVAKVVAHLQVLK